MKRFWIASLLAFAFVGCSLGGGFIGNVPQKTGPAPAPEIVSSHGVATFNISADTAASGLPEFVYQGQPGVAPTIRVNPGDTIVVNLTNHLSGSGMPSDLNLHFHGLGVSPNKPSDDVLTMLAHPGQKLHYVVRVPSTQPPGLYWYHPHVHGETEYQVGQGGMSGAIVINGITKRYPQLANAPEQLMIIRSVGGSPGKDIADHRRRLLALKPDVPCPILYSGYLSVNGQLQTNVPFQPGKPQFFRIVNATGHRTLDLTVRGLPMQIVAIDGYPIDQANGPKTATVSDFVVPPAGRVEFVVTPTKKTTLFSRCYNSGPAGDQDPPQVLATLTPQKGAATIARTAGQLDSPMAPASSALTANLPPPAQKRLVVFTEDLNGFYINGQAFDPLAKPMFVAHTGTIEQWTVENRTSEMHDFHLHQVHFLVESIDGVRVKSPVWSDSFVVPWQTKSHGTRKPGTIVLLADFRPKIIAGTFLFHCHILDHEDQGMMAKIQVL